MLSQYFKKSHVFIIVIYIVSCYSNTIHAPFVFDDIYLVSLNDSIKKLSFDIFTEIPPTSSTIKRPIANLSIALNYFISGEEPWSYHYLNILIFITTALFLYFSLKLMFKYIDLFKEDVAMRATLAFSITLIWVCHPILTECVSYLGARTQLLMGLFAVLSFYNYFKFLDEPKNRYQYSSLFFCSLGMACRETMIVVPALIYLFDSTFVTGSLVYSFKQKKKYFILLFSTTIVIVICLLTSKNWAYIINPKVDDTQFYYSDLNWMNNVLTKPGIIIHYLKLMFVPTQLTANYVAWPLKNSISESWQELVLFFVIVMMFLFLVYKYRKLSYLGFYFIAFLLPSTVCLLPLQFVAERYMYMSSLAVVLLVVLFVLKIAMLPKVRSKVQAQHVVLVFCFITSTALSIRTFSHNETYSSEITFWKNACDVEPKNYKARASLGNAYLKYGPQLQKAFIYYKESVDIRPDYSEGYIGLGNIYIAQKDYVKAREYFNLAKGLKPHPGRAYVGLGHIYYRNQDYSNAIKEYKMALGKNYQTPSLLLQLGTSLMFLKQYKESISYLKMARQKDASNESVHLNLAGAFFHDKQFKEAIKSYKDVLKINELNINAITNLVTVYRHVKKREEAQDLITTKLELFKKHNMPKEYNILMNIYRKYK